MEEVVNIAKALSDPHRVRAVMALRRGELCACELIELFRLAPSTVSKHMSVLKRNGLVSGRKKGKWMFYSLPTHPTKRITAILQWVISACSDEIRIKDDDKRIKKIGCS